MDNTARQMQIRSLESNRYSNEHRKHDVGQIPSSRSFRNLRSFGSSSGILRYSNWRIHASVARISVRRLHTTIRFSPAHLYPSTCTENVVISFAYTSLLIYAQHSYGVARLYNSLCRRVHFSSSESKSFVYQDQLLSLERDVDGSSFAHRLYLSRILSHGLCFLRSCISLLPFRRG